MIKTKKEEKEEERSSLTTIVEKQVEPDGRTSAGKGEKRWRCNEVESNQSGSGIFYYAGLSRLWHSCFVEPSVDGDRVLRDRGLDYDRPSRFPYISRASNGPLILRRLEKPEIKKRNMRRYMYRGASWRERERERERNGLPPFGTGSAFRPSRCSPSSHPCFGSFHDSLRIRRTRSNEQTIIRDKREHHYDNNVAW